MVTAAQKATASARAAEDRRDGSGLSSSSTGIWDNVAVMPERVTNPVTADNSASWHLRAATLIGGLRDIPKPGAAIVVVHAAIRPAHQARGEAVSVSVVVPCYHSAPTLPTLVARLGAVLPGCTDAYEIILVVDDGDGETWQVAEGLQRRDRTVRAFRLSRNYGQHNALIAGVREARHDVVVTMDDDLQHRPEEIPTLAAALTDDVDLVYGVAAEEEHGAARSLASRTAKTLLEHALKVRSARHISAFRAFRTFLREGFAGLDGPDVSLDVALSWGTTRIAAVTV